MANKKKILIIDDALFIRKMLSYFLQKTGYDVLMADTGSEGITLASENHPDLIFCDINLPDKDGFEVAATLQDNKYTAQIPLIFVSGKEFEAEDKRKLEAVKAKAVVTKPFDLDQIRAVLEKNNA